MSFKQFNCAYVVNDDRIIFRFNTVDSSEYKFWFTRRVTHLILISANQFLEKQTEKQALSIEKVMSEFQQSDKQASNFSSGYEPGVLYPIGADPILVMDVRCQMTKTEELDIFSLDLLLPGGGNVNLKLPLHIMQKLILLLEELNMQAKWGNPISTF